MQMKNSFGLINTNFLKNNDFWQEESLYSSVVELLLGMYKALVSIASTTNFFLNFFKIMTF